MEGFEVMPALAAAPRADVLVTVTGSRGVLGAEHFAVMKGALANAGHFDVEIRPSTRCGPRPATCATSLPLVQQYDLGERRLNLLASAAS